ncbi:MAG: MFS transporter, partial [Desulfovibrionales bacterium]|nr:MFS transporter [Desulfovibrionales bacterium]
MTQSRKSTDWLQVVILCLAGGTIFILPYLRYGYYDAMIASLHITNTQLGTIMAAYGAFTLPSYLVGGLLADRFSARNLLVFSFFTTALGGFYLMTSPAYLGIFLVHGFWGISTVLTFWAAYFKIVRLSASAENQGKMFGIINGGRRVASMVIASVGLWIFARYGDQVTGFRITLAFFSGFHVVLAALFFVLWKTESITEEDAEEDAGGLTFAGIKEALRMPSTWFMAGIIFGVYGSYRFGDFFTPYLTQGLGIAPALAGVIGTVKAYAITPVGSFAAGVAADKVGRIRLCMGVVVIAIFCKLAFLVIPQGASYLAIGNIMLFMLMIWAAYTLIYAIM